MRLLCVVLPPQIELKLQLKRDNFQRGIEFYTLFLSFSAFSYNTYFVSLFKLLFRTDTKIFALFCFDIDSLNSFPIVNQSF